MARKRKKDTKANNAMLPVMRPDAAGIDIGATEIFVAVPADRATENVRSFPTFTQALCLGGLVEAMRGEDGSDGIHRCVLDSVVPDSGGPRHRGLPG